MLSFVVLRQIALKTFHGEIRNLRTQVQQISLERDTLQNSLNRTMDDKQKLVQLGQEQVDLVSKESERIMKWVYISWLSFSQLLIVHITSRDKEQEHLQRLKESEKYRREEQLQIEDRYSSEFVNLQKKLDQVKSGMIHL